MKGFIKITTILVFINCSFLHLKAQENAPWEKFKSMTVSGVYLAPGCHEFSLSGGQGYSVYLKNSNPNPVNVSGWLVAKTTCGKESFSKFNVNLEPGEIAAGDNFTKGNITGQTSYVTGIECYGNKVNNNAGKIDRINEVYVKDIIVNNIGQQTEVPYPAKPKESYTYNFDSLNYHRTKWNTERDALNADVLTTKASYQTLNNSYYQKSTLLDSFLAAKNNKNTFSSANKNSTFSLQTGLGYNVLPTFSNNTTLLKTTPTTIGFPFVQIGVLAKLFNDKKLNVELNPFASYGNSLSQSNKGDHLNWGLLSNVLYTLTSSNNLKLVGNLGYMGRVGNWLNGVEFGDYNYNLIRYGGGLRYAINENIFIQPSVVVDNSNETNNDRKNSLVFNLDAGIKNWNIGLSYGNNYNNQGSRLFVTPIENQDLFGVKLLYNFLFR